MIKSKFCQNLQYQVIYSKLPAPLMYSCTTSKYKLGGKIEQQEEGWTGVRTLLYGTGNEGINDVIKSDNVVEYQSNLSRRV